MRMAAEQSAGTLQRRGVNTNRVHDRHPPQSSSPRHHQHSAPLANGDHVPASNGDDVNGDDVPASKGNDVNGDHVPASPHPKHPKPLQDHATLTHRQVDFMFVEPYILGGYRQPHQPWRYYLLSALWLHNETLNVWTHLLGCLCVLTRALFLGQELDGFRDPRSVPVLGFVLGCVLNNLFSSLAHLLHSKSARHHYVLYFMDYAGITFYNLGNSIGSMYSCSHPVVFAQLKSVYLPIMTTLSWLSFLACVLARLRFKGHFSLRRKVIMVSVFLSKAFFIAWPLAGRYLDCVQDPRCSLASLNHITIVFAFFALDGLCFLAHAPERWWPGKFDIWGHGHQWFHVCTVVTQQLQLHALHVDLVSLQRGHHAASSLDGLSMLGFFLGLGLVNALSVRALSSAVDQKVAEMHGQVWEGGEHLHLQ